MIRLLIGDANLLIRTGIRTVLTEAFTIDEIGEVASAAELLANLRAREWSLCVLDVALPERGGLEVASYVRKARGNTRLLFLSSYADRPYVASALKEGARGFILKDCARVDLQAAVRTILDGGFYVSPQLSEQLLGVPFSDRPSHERLSLRELQVFRKLARGAALKVISRDLSISPKSVSTYRARILEKTRCRNNAEIAQYAMREGLL